MKHHIEKIAILLFSISIALTFTSCEEEKTYDITPQNPVTALAVKTPPTVVEYYAGDLLDLTGLVVEVTYQDGTAKDVGAGYLERNRIVTTPANGDPVDENLSTIALKHYTSGNTAVSGSIFSILEPEYVPATMPWPAAWPENNVYFMTNFVGVDQVDGGNAGNTIMPGAWVWAGGDLDNTNWNIINETGYSYLNMAYMDNGNGWGAWMLGGISGLPNEINNLKYIADIRGKGRWLLQLVDGSETHFSAAVDLVEDDGWMQIERPFTDFGSFDVSTIGTTKVSIETGVTTDGDYINITNIRFVKSE